MIRRTLQQTITDRLFQQKIIVILGPRQVGKTTLVRSIADSTTLKYKWFSGDEPDVRAIFQNITSTQFKQIVGDTKLVIFDEAQRIENVGIMLKLAIDNFPEIQIMATGSSGFDLSNKLREPLTGRKYLFMMYPFSYEELSNHNGLLEERRLLEHRLIYGSYPDVVNRPSAGKEILNLLTDSYLYKDLLEHEGIKKSSLLYKILAALALQVGSEVSFNEVAQTVGADKNTVEKYIDLLEQVFVIFKVYALSRNVRNELKKSKKIYFYDNGVRNAILGNFSTFSTRTDVGALWENYLVSERWKFIQYHQLYGNRFFWRTTAQQEIDYLEERDGIILAYEFKWSTSKKTKFPTTFTAAYANAVTAVITPDNYASFLQGS